MVLKMEELFRFLEIIQFPATHQKVGKETGLTNHIERLNNTIRQRFSRLVGKSLSFSKKEYMLNLHFKL
jgi:IS1 family transposase